MNLTKAAAHSLGAKLKPEARLFINGRFAAASDGGTFETINPATGAVVATVAHATADDVDRAVAAARKVFEQRVWSRAAPEFCKSVLLKLANLIRKIKEE